MFEKSLYDLIKGLRNHKGAEEDYIQDCLRECKAEIRSQDMDKKATALLKIVYLEMFGYDMSWASFHVLEVMSSTKYLQKRAGYLGAVQSFRPDTEVLMLATNLLKKDLISSSIPSMSLPMITLPHIISPSLAMSLLPDVLSRVSHSHAVVRKKAVVCLYRLSLAYPEALKLAWPKLKDRLMDDDEDSSVTTAVLNVVCELGWRRPHDFLPLAPRFFDLLVDGGNNWMAIKIIKLFATLTPLEPRLIRKLTRPLMNIIQTTTAMSLLYECINGIIQGGILDGDEGLEEQDKIASLCVGKLRGMIVADSDPNLKYVALIAFNRIVVSHPTLVSMHQDVIMDCLEDADISIRLQALELATRMVTGDTLQSVVDQLINQLNKNSTAAKKMPADSDTTIHAELEDSDGEDLKTHKSSISLPDDYKMEVLHRILDMCSYNNYSELLDFEWYVDVLVQLVKLLPPTAGGYYSQGTSYHVVSEDNTRNDVAFRLGSELRNVAVRVKGVRMEATRAAEYLILIDNRPDLFSNARSSSGILGPLTWVVGEYAEYLSSPGRTLQSLIDTSNISLPARTLSLYVQAIPKVLVSLINDNDQAWSTLRKSETSLLLARIIEFLEALASHPDLDVQERAIEFLEVMRLTADAVLSDVHVPEQVPFLLSSMIPSLFYGLELNPVAVNAQKKVPLPDKLVLNQAFNSSLSTLFRDCVAWSPGLGNQDILQDFYYVRETPTLNRQPNDPTSVDMQSNASYQQFPDGHINEVSAIAKRKAERRERNRDDPFYIGADGDSSGTSTPFHQIFAVSNGGELDFDSIPIIDLELNNMGTQHTSSLLPRENRRRPQPGLKRYNITADETIGIGESMESEGTGESGKIKRTLLQIDSSGLRHLALGEEDVSTTTPDDISKGRNEHDAEMAKAVQEVERLRLEMQRASERIHPEGIPVEGTLVKKKKKVKKSVASEQRGALQDRLGDNGTQDEHSRDIRKKRRKGESN